MKKYVFISALNLIAFISCFSQSAVIQQKEDSVALFLNRISAIESRLEGLKLAQIRADIRANALPKLEPNQQLVEHLAYFLVYSEQHEQALWVAHKLTPDVLKGSEGRTNDFRIDTMISTGSASEEDYFIRKPKADGTFDYDGFGFDRGHLAPSADFRWSKKALSESYFYSNMTPQRPDFNRDSWAKLEDKMRAYIVQNPTANLYIVTGPVLLDSLPKVERSIHQVSIPYLHYKLALDLENKHAIAFLMPNKKAEFGYTKYATSIDEIEKLTGIDFYTNLPDSIEERLEAMNDPTPFLSSADLKDVEPIFPPSLPKNHFNTVQAESYMRTNKRVTVCGTVVSARKSAKGNVFLNLDKQFPNQLFTVSIFSNNSANFSYSPEEVLLGKQICVTGIITDYNGKPSMAIENEKAIEMYDEKEE